MKNLLLHLCACIVAVPVNTLVQRSAEPQKKMEDVFLLTDQRKYIPVSLYQTLTIMLAPDDTYFPADKYDKAYHIFYADKENSEQKLGLRLHWIQFHSESCTSIRGREKTAVTLLKNHTSPSVIVFDYPCTKQLEVMTIEPGNVNISYSGKPHDDKLLLSLTPYQVMTGGTCQAGFVSCPEKKKTICISEGLVCEKSDTGCQIITNQCLPTNEPYSKTLPLGFIWAISALVVAGLLFLMGLIIWYSRCKKPKERETNSISSVAKLRVPRAEPNDYIQVPPREAPVQEPPRESQARRKSDSDVYVMV